MTEVRHKCRDCQKEVLIWNSANPERLWADTTVNFHVKLHIDIDPKKRVSFYLCQSCFEEMSGPGFLEKLCEGGST